VLGSYFLQKVIQLLAVWARYSLLNIALKTPLNCKTSGRLAAKGAVIPHLF